VTPEPRTCAVCGHDAGLEASWVRWDARGTERHEAVDRCADRAACRRRVEESGGVWWPLDSAAKP
jgi:hypothetical protein